MPDLTIEVTEAEAGDRLDALVARHAGISRAKATDLLASGCVHVAGRREPKSYRVRAGDVVDVELAPTEQHTLPSPPIDVAYEDDDLLVVDKQAGVVVHPAPGAPSGTLVDALRGRGVPLAARAGPERPGVVHRLDRDVSGLLVVAKTDQAHETLTAAMASRRIRREYLAGVAGVPEVDSGKIDAPVGRDPKHRQRMTVSPDGRPSVTWFRVRERLAAASLLEVRLETGRTHQIRTHLASIGHPIIGDAVYGRDRGLAELASLVRPFLHAWRLTFDHPVTGRPIEITSELPADLDAAVKRLRE